MGAGAFNYGPQGPNIALVKSIDDNKILIVGGAFIVGVVFLTSICVGIVYTKKYVLICFLDNVISLYLLNVQRMTVNRDRRFSFIIFERIHLVFHGEII